MNFNAAYFDGRSARRHEVTVHLHDDRVVVQAGDICRSEAWPDVRVAERVKHIPATLTFSDGAYCEITDNAALYAWLEEHRQAPGWVVRAQNSGYWAVGALILTIAVLWAGYVYVLPWGVERVALNVPATVAQSIGTESLKFLDEHLFKPSALPSTERERLAARFAALTPPEPLSLRYRLVFRASKVGPNAFALPDGTIVITDELIALADSDDAVMGVLAHELGHVARRHMLRQLLQSAAVGATVGLLFGDVSTVLTALPATLAELAYSREFEREADAYAVAMLRKNGVALAPLANLFEKLHTAHSQRHDSEQDNSYLSSHPSSRERIAEIRRHITP